MGIGVKTTLYKVDDNELYAPSKAKPQISHDNIVTPDSGRAEDGYMHIHWVRRDVKQITLTWDKLTGNEMEYLRNLLQGQEFVLTYYDAGIKTINAYCGKFSEQLDNVYQYADEGGLYRNIQATITEM